MGDYNVVEKKGIRYFWSGICFHKKEILDDKRINFMTNKELLISVILQKYYDNQIDIKIY